MLKCHAGAAHAVAADHGAFGDLCDFCWTAVRRLLKRK